MEAGTQEQLIRKWTEVAHPGRVLQAVPPGVAEGPEWRGEKGQNERGLQDPYGPQQAPGVLFQWRVSHGRP